MMKSTILALELDTAMGWALRTPDGQIVSGTQSFKPGRYGGGVMTTESVASGSGSAP